MADLSNLLGDVYGDPAAEPVAVPAPPAPAWADDHHLDEAFATWKPEPLTPVLADAVAAEPASSAPSAPLDDDLAAALSAALAEAPRATAVAPPAPPLPEPGEVPAPLVAPAPPVAPVDVVPEPVAPVAPAAPEPVVASAWHPSDDDILPRGVKKSGFRLR